MKWEEKTVIFDLDGTLIDSAPDLHAALQYAFEKKGFESIDLQTVRSAVGHGALAMLRKSADVKGILLNEAEFNELRDIFLEHYVANISRFSRPFHGIISTLDELKSKNANVVVCTNKTQALADQVLKELDMEKYFKVVLGADKASQKKPNAAHILETVLLADGDIKQSVMIGDSSTDGNAALAANIPFIFMEYGYPDDSVTTLSPVSSLSSAQDLLSAIEDALS